jgi:hypothetical protein
VQGKTERMREFFSSGLVADVVLAFMFVEGLVLILAYRKTGKGIAPLNLFFGLAAGACLVLALRAAMTGAAWHWIAVALLASLAAHVVDIYRRW